MMMFRLLGIEVIIEFPVSGARCAITIGPYQLALFSLRTRPILFSDMTGVAW
jgi:hypothetical protein